MTINQQSFGALNAPSTDPFRTSIDDRYNQRSGGQDSIDQPAPLATDLMQNSKDHSNETSIADVSPNNAETMPNSVVSTALEQEDDTNRMTIKQVLSRNPKAGSLSDLDSPARQASSHKGLPLVSASFDFKNASGMGPTVHSGTALNASNTS